MHSKKTKHLHGSQIYIRWTSCEESSSTGDLVKTLQLAISQLATSLTHKGEDRKKKRRKLQVPEPLKLQVTCPERQQRQPESAMTSGVLTWQDHTEGLATTMPRLETPQWLGGPPKTMCQS